MLSKIVTDQILINVRAVIQNNNNLLLCSLVNQDYFFLPGGGVEFGEGAAEALGRELQEELGAKLVNASFIGAVENLFGQQGKPSHELNLVFSAQIDDGPIDSQEDHITFSWVPIERLDRENILPKHLVAAVQKWLKDGKVFWVGMQ